MLCGRHDDQVGIDNVGRVRVTEQRPDVMGLVGGKRHDLATTKESTQLDLSPRPTRLSDNWGGGDRSHAKLQANSVFGPSMAVVTVRGDEHAGVVDNAHAERCRLAESI